MVPPFQNQTRLPCRLHFMGKHSPKQTAANNQIIIHRNTSYNYQKSKDQYL